MLISLDQDAKNVTFEQKDCISMSKAYFAYIPTIKGSVEEEWKQCLNQILVTCSSGFIPVKLNIFVDLPDFETLLPTRKSIGMSMTYAFGKCSPAYNVSVHPPAKPWKTSVEAAFIPSGSMEVSYKSFKSIPYVILETVYGREIWAAGVSTYSYQNDTMKAAENAFNMMVSLLETEKMSLNNIVRQWNYIGDILSVNDGVKNYQIFNEVRKDFYSRFRTLKGFPAATGVGMKHGGVILDFCALKPVEKIKIIAIDNPNQVNAYNYRQEKHPPQFERALLISNDSKALLHISGTASIIGQETMGRGSIEEQTLVTIENIKKLADPERISQLLATPFISLEKFSLLRVYIKQPGDFSIVRSICSSHFPKVSAVYIEADICRDDLLMEIEAEAELSQ